MNIRIRKAVESDSEKVWPLMKELAIFEHYIDSFAITPEVVRQKGFQKNPPDFYCIVADDIETDKIAGMLVYYFIPYTAQNRPAIYMKELYVEETYRSKGVGRELMAALREEARLNNCGQIKNGPSRLGTTRASDSMKISARARTAIGCITNGMYNANIYLTNTMNPRIETLAETKLIAD